MPEWLFEGPPLAGVLERRLRDALRAVTELGAAALAEGAPDPVGSLTAGFAPELPAFDWDAAVPVVSVHDGRVVAVVRVPVTTGDDVTLKTRPNAVFLGGFAPRAVLRSGAIESPVHARVVDETSIAAHTARLRAAADRYAAAQGRVVARFVPDAVARVTEAVAARQAVFAAAADLQAIYLPAVDELAADSAFASWSDEDLVAGLIALELPRTGGRADWIERLAHHEADVELDDATED
ncbi:hypothetical protein [Leifsonia sp. WHRI 6310E]|uniref:hypothetical protein n=1 Tax=Leifsonia sp. WHRI 6310E TaxID=3162562 RepID=UPI0032EF7D85